MKRLIILALSVFVLVFTAGCADGENGTATTLPATVAQGQTLPEGVMRYEPLSNANTKTKAVCIDVNKKITDLNSVVEDILNNGDVIELDITCSGATDLSPLQKLIKLKKLTISGANSVESFSPLQEMTNLKTLLIYNSNISEEESKALKQALPKCSFSVDLDGCEIDDECVGDQCTTQAKTAKGE